LNTNVQDAVPSYQKNLAKQVTINNIDVKWYNKYVDKWVEKINLNYLK